MSRIESVFSYKEVDMRLQKLLAFTALLLLLAIPLAGVAREVDVYSGEEEEGLDCSENLLVAYFPPSIVNQVLRNYQIPQDLWPEINAELQDQNDKILTLVEEKASKIKQNPLYDVRQKNISVGIYRESLLHVFGDIMKKYGIDREEQIRAMLDEIQYKKAKRFRDCLEERKKAANEEEY